MEVTTSVCSDLESLKFEVFFLFNEQTRPSRSTSVAPCFWTNSEVLQWMKNSLPELFNKYGGFFKAHGIRGKKNEFYLLFICDKELQ